MEDAMKSLFLITGLILAATTAEAQTTRLDKPYVVCRTLTYAAAITDTNEAPVSTLTGMTMNLLRQGECILLPKGEVVLVQKREGIFACVSPPSGGQCGWTVMVRRHR
jgi:hypothetical protein